MSETKAGALMRFNLIAESGRFDRTVAAYRETAQRDNALASVIASTEKDLEKWHPALRYSGWSFFRSEGEEGRDDTSLRWKNDTWSLDGDPDVVCLSHIFYGPHKQNWASVVPLRHRSGQRVTFITVHMPAGVEGDFRIRRGERWRVYLESLAAIRQLVAFIRKADPKTKIVFAGDLNLNLKRWAIRMFFRHQLRGTDLRPRWSHAAQRQAGDYENRTITWAFHDLTLTRSSTLAATAASDHRAMLFHLEV